MTVSQYQRHDVSPGRSQGYPSAPHYPYVRNALIRSSIISRCALVAVHWPIRGTGLVSSSLSLSLRGCSFPKAPSLPCVWLVCRHFPTLHLSKHAPHDCHPAVSGCLLFSALPPLYLCPCFRVFVVSPRLVARAEAPGHARLLVTVPPVRYTQGDRLLSHVSLVPPLKTCPSQTRWCPRYLAIMHPDCAFRRLHTVRLSLRSHGSGYPLVPRSTPFGLITRPALSLTRSVRPLREPRVRSDLLARLFSSGRT